MFLVSIASTITTRCRFVHTYLASFLQCLHKSHLSKIHSLMNEHAVKKKLKIYPPPASAAKTFKDPVAAVTESQLAVLDPDGARKALFSRKNPEAAKVGDILLVTFKTGDPYSGVCLNIRQRGVDTSILLRNQLTKIGVEMWVKIFSPNVQGIEVVQRREKRARRARLYYMRFVSWGNHCAWSRRNTNNFVFCRKPEHDMGSVQNLVYQYIRQKQAMRAGGDRRGRSRVVGKTNKTKR
jgi:large subunit ribosomal protein L19